MKVSKLLLFIPVIALSACSSIGKEISKEEASEKAHEIVEKQSKTESYYFSYSLTNNMDDAKESRYYKIAIDENDDYMISREEKETSKSGTYKSSKEIYVFKPSKSEQVLYIKQFDGATNKTKIEVYSLQVNGYDEFQIMLGKQSSFKSEANGYYQSSAFALFQEPVAGPSYDSQYKYYSKGEGNMTAKLTFTYNGEKDDSTIKSIKRNYSYSDNLLTNYEASYVTFGGHKRTETATCKYKNINISFPTDWEDHIRSGMAY